MRENPPWVGRVIAHAFDSLSSQIPPNWMPRLSDVHASRRGELVGEIKEYGCGMYGCVVPTIDPDTVLKLTTDPSEAEFASRIAGELVVPVTVIYRMVAALSEQHNGRKIYALWRESADDVGQIERFITREQLGYLEMQHRAAQQAYLALHQQRSGVTRTPNGIALKGDLRLKLIEWEAAFEVMISKIPILRQFGSDVLRVWESQGIFFGDIHKGNIGRVFRGAREGSWVITDPGHVAVIQS